ncbi:LysE family translocator [Fluviispira multicolorata]|uniref:LysE family translocator n=1 Tax=Fluviispira multicolorata TaxID=2654512 RepID=A0A833JDF7_9BACT|nr:LysE family translocator [Fluviispira multicolorata]KAB8031858.1 LysE family translocator [Fluviispira multicolorata]
MESILNPFAIFIILGLGAAAPIGPINIEIMRRHLNISWVHALVFGLGACLADLVYLALMGLGLLELFSNSIYMPVFGILGALLVFWFGIMSFKLPSTSKSGDSINKSFSKQLFDGVLLTFLNPYNVIFWLSVSVQINNLVTNKGSLLIGGLGTITGILLWVILINLIIYFSKKKLTHKTVKIINYISGVILIVLASYFGYNSINLLLNKL